MLSHGNIISISREAGVSSFPSFALSPYRMDVKTPGSKIRYNRADRTKYPSGPEQSYRKVTGDLMKSYKRIIAEDVIPTLGDASIDPTRIFRGLAAAKERADKMFGSDNVEAAIHRIYSRLDVQNTNAIRKHLSRMQHIGDVILARMPRERDLASYVADSVALIKTIPVKSLGEIGDLVASAHMSDVRVEDLRNSIMERYDVSLSRAELISRDQVGKTNAGITQAKCISVGIIKYAWSGSLDERERPDHLELEGKIFYFSDPPIVDKKSGRRANPGEDFSCRCTPYPVLDESEAQLEEAA
jgi:SPP1 gp7 family putative phage head morphogenesis protein